MTNENKFSHFILELTLRTKKGLINWDKSPIPKSSKFDDFIQVIDFVYQTEYDHKVFQIYKYKIKSHLDEYTWEWSEKVNLALVDINGNSLFDFPYDYSLYNLYDSVREKTSGISDILDSFFKSA